MVALPRSLQNILLFIGFALIATVGANDIAAEPNSQADYVSDHDFCSTGMIDSNDFL